MIKISKNEIDSKNFGSIYSAELFFLKEINCDKISVKFNYKFESQIYYLSNNIKGLYLDLMYDKHVRGLKYFKNISKYKYCIVDEDYYFFNDKFYNV